MAFATLDDVYSWTGLEPGSEDDRLELLLAATYAAITAFLGYSPTLESHTRTFDGDGGTALFLPDRPVLSVQAVSFDGRPQPVSMFRVGKFALYRVGGERFPRGVQNIEATYTAGCDPVPAWAKLAALNWIKATAEVMFDPERASGVTKLKAGDHEQQFAANDGLTSDLGGGVLCPMPATVAGVLRLYRRMAPC